MTGEVEDEEKIIKKTSGEQKEVEHRARLKKRISDTK